MGLENGPFDHRGWATNATYKYVYNSKVSICSGYMEKQRGCALATTGKGGRSGVVRSVTHHLEVDTEERAEEGEKPIFLIVTYRGS